MASVALHPLASRSGAQTSTIVSVDVQPDKTPTLSSSAPQIHDSEHDSLFGSCTTDRASSPHPFTTDDDDNRLQNNNGIEWGLHHSDIEKYPILDGQYDDEQDQSTSNPPPIRAMSAGQFEELQRQYVELDVPHSVVFPFLHGVDGDNQAQCAFFRAPMTGQPTPLYRGLTIVRADMPQQRKRTSSSASKLSMMSSQQNHRSRAGSLISSNFSADSTSSDEDDDFDLEDDLALIDHQSSIPASNSTSSGSSAASESHASSLFSFAGSEVTMNTQVDSDSYKATEAAANHAREHRQRKRSLRNSGASNVCSRSPPIVEAQPGHSFLASSVYPNDIINPPLVANLVSNSLDVARQCQVIQDERCIVKGATFMRPRQADGISLRNFKTQCAKYATISDIVVYCPAGLHEGALNFANWIRQAQETCYQDRIERGLGSLRYNVFVITDSFDVFERQYPHLVSVDGSGFSRQRVDFVDREREEMQRFTEASEIDENVFMGCTANVPFAVDEYEGSSLSLDSYLPHEVNPHAFSVCIETAEHGELPSQSRLAHASYYLDAFEASTLHDLSEFNGDSDDGEDAERPSLGPTGWNPAQARSESRKRDSQQQRQQQVLCPAPSNIVHLRGLGSGSAFEDEDAEQDAIDDVVNMISWIYKQAMPPTKSPSPSSSFWRPRQGTYANGERHQQQMPRRILLHCSDGYTDSSILGLAYLMYARNLTLAEAYLDLQTRCNRCFFVYARDVPFLQKLEKRFAAMEHHAKAAAAEKQRNSWGYSEERQSSRKASNGVIAHRRDQSETAASVLEQSVWARGLAAATGLMTGGNALAGQGSHGKRSTEMTRTTTPTPRRSTPTPQSPHREIRKDHSWFTNPHFQGSFPSRILPFLYLGNLSHAMNPGMLHALGITHVVSVGESALIPPSLEENLENAAKAHKRNSSSTSSISNRMASNTLRTSKRRSGGTGQEHKTLWEEERMGRIKVLDLKGVSDDGIDSLRPHLNRAVEFIEQARLEGGKVLVHCRVGVSRSATVCIAYAMAHCDLSMIESFLLVRSRRMNVLTQPTLLFVWELRGFEAHLTKLKRQRANSPNRAIAHHLPASHDDDEMMNDADDAFSLAALSLSSGDMSHDQDFSRKFSFRSASEPVQLEQHPSLLNLTSRQSIFFDEDLKVDIGAGAGSVYGFQVRNVAEKPFNSGSLTRLDHRSAKLTHGCFCKLLSELNQRYMVN